MTKEVTFNKEADATKRVKKTSKTTKFVSVKKSKLELITQYDDKAADTKNKQTAKITVKYSPTKVGYKGMKWKAKNKKIVYVSPVGVVTPLKKGSTKIYGYTKDGTNKKVTLNVTVKAPPVTATPTPLLEEDTRVATTVENFESYAEGTDWTKTSGYTAGGFENSGTMTVVKDPENPKNKVLKVDYTGKDQAFDFAPVFHLDLGDKTLGDYNALRFKSRIISNSSDCNYKTVATYFDAYNSIKPADYFDTSNNSESSAKKASDAKYRFGVNISMATGVDKNYNVPDKVKAGLAIQDKDMIAISPGKKYNNKVFPTYYSDYSPPTNDKTAVSPGYSEEETNASNKVGFQQNTLEFSQERINDAWISGSDTTPLLQRNKVDMVFGSTYTGSQGRDWAAWHLVLYIDDIQLMSGAIACKEMKFVNPPTSMACGDSSKGIAASEATLEVSYEPKNTTQREVTFTSSNTELATVDSSGKVVANSEGKSGDVVITATNNANNAVVAKTTIKIEYVAPATEDYNILTSAGTKILAKGTPSATSKVVSDTDGGTLADGKMTLKYDATNQSYVIDLGSNMNLNRYTGIEIGGVAPGQLALELYSSSLDMTATKDNGAEKDWWETAAGATYPFFVGSCSWRYEGGGMNRLKAWENGYPNTMYPDDKTMAGPSPETLRYSLNQLAKTGDWSSIRYIILKTNKDPQLIGDGEFDAKSVTENRTKYDYQITSFKLLSDNVVEASSAGHYILDTTKNVAEKDGNVTSYYVDNITDANTAEKHNSSMNLSDFKYIKAQVKNTENVKIGLIENGKKLADATIIGEETGSGDRSVYVSLKGVDQSVLKKIDAISVELDKDGTLSGLSATKGEISCSKKGEVKVEVSGTTVTPVTLEKYGSEE